MNSSMFNEMPLVPRLAQGLLGPHGTIPMPPTLQIVSSGSSPKRATAFCSQEEIG